MNLIASLYGYIYSLLGNNELLVGLIGSYVFSSGVFWLVNAFLLPADLLQWPKWMQRYKVQKDQNVPINMPKFYKALRIAVFNTIFINMLGTYPLYLLQKQIGTSFDPNNVPGLLGIIRDILMSAICGEITFYHSHRLIHHPLLYKCIHKRHHEWTAPIGIVSVYATLPEYLFGNIMPVLSGPLLLRSHIAVTWLWLSIALFSTIVTHSGYHLPLLNPPEMHDFHHYNFEGNYGSLGLLDALYGTNAKFKKTIGYKRRRLLFSTTPIDDLYPSEHGPYKVIRD